MKQQTLDQGTVLGKRFKIESLAGEGDLGVVYKAQDIESSQLVSLRVLPGSLIPQKADIERIRTRVKEASKLSHRNIQATFGFGVEDDGTIYIASEWVDGKSLRNLLGVRTKANKRFSFKGAYNLMGHVCNALTYAHNTTFHSSICPRAILVNAVGRVKVGDWGLSVIRTTLSAYKGRGKLESVFWAPEVLEDAANAQKSADIYSLGALFYELVTGVPPERPLKAPSQLGFSSDVDAVIARCMAAVPSQRFSNPADVKSAILELVQSHQSEDEELPEEDDDLSLDLEIDLTDLKGAPDSDAAARGTPPPAAGMLSAPGLPPPPKDNALDSGEHDEMPRDSRASTIDMGQVLSSLGKSEAAHWMVQKDKFDHGPFTDRELVQMIMTGEVLGKHMLQNMDTGVRKKIKAWGDFDEYLERYRVKKKKQDEQVAMARTKKAETRGTMFKWVIVAGVVGVLILGGVGYFISRQFREEKEVVPEDLIAALDSGEIKIKTGGNLRKKLRRRGKQGRRRAGSRGGSGGGGGGGEFVPGMSYDEAMNVAVELGSLKNKGGQKQLTPQTISRIMDRNVRRFLPCVAGGSVKKVSMDLVIGGNGKVIGVSVAQGDSKLKRCVSSKIRQIKFPESPAPRTPASWYFELY